MPTCICAYDEEGVMKSRFVEIRLVRMSHPYGHVVSDKVLVGYWDAAPCKSYVTVANNHQSISLNVPVKEFLDVLRKAQKRTEGGALRLLAVIGAKTCVKPVV